MISERKLVRSIKINEKFVVFWVLKSQVKTDSYHMNIFLVFSSEIKRKRVNNLLLIGVCRMKFENNFENVLFIFLVVYHKKYKTGHSSSVKN